MFMLRKLGSLSSLFFFQFAVVIFAQWAIYLIEIDAPTIFTWDEETKHLLFKFATLHFNKQHENFQYNYICQFINRVTL